MFGRNSRIREPTKAILSCDGHGDYAAATPSSSMRLHQTWKNFVSAVVLQRNVPFVTAWVRDWLVEVHTDFFVEHSERSGEARRPHLQALFEVALDAYLAALDEGYPEAAAREITHIQASWDFQNHGWGDLVEFPPDERDAYYERYRDFFERHGATPANPFGRFAPAGLPDAPTTPGRMDGEYPLAQPGLTDDVYVYAEHDEQRLRCSHVEVTP